MICGEISRETNEKRTISQVITTKFPMQSSREFYCAEQGIWQADQGISTIKVLHARNQCGGCDREACCLGRPPGSALWQAGVRRAPYQDAWDSVDPREVSPHSPDDAIICSVDAAIQLT